MRLMSVLVSDELANELELEARESNRDLAELAGEKLAVATAKPIDQRVLELLKYTPDTKVVSGRLVYTPPAEPSDWVKALRPETPPTDGTNGMHRVYGALETPEEDSEIALLLQEES